MIDFNYLINFNYSFKTKCIIILIISTCSLLLQTLIANKFLIFLTMHMDNLKYQIPVCLCLEVIHRLRINYIFTSIRLEGLLQIGVYNYRDLLELELHIIQNHCWYHLLSILSFLMGLLNTYTWQWFRYPMAQSAIGSSLLLVVQLYGH